MAGIMNLDNHQIDPSAMPSFEEWKKVELSLLDKQQKNNQGILYWADKFMECSDFLHTMATVEQINQLVEREDRLLETMKEKLEALTEEEINAEDYAKHDLFSELIIKSTDIETGELFDYYCAMCDYIYIRSFGEDLLQYNMSCLLKQAAEEMAE